jgi:hypothetical protein
MKNLLTAGAFACALSVGLAGCSNSVTLSPGAQATEAQILAEICPVVADAAPYVGQFNGNVQKAYATLSLACPPNPAPTNLVIALADLQAAYSILQPVVTGMIAKAHKS